MVLGASVLVLPEVEVLVTTLSLESVLLTILSEVCFEDDELSQSHLLYLSVGVAMKMAAGMMLSLVWESAGGWLMVRMWMCWPCDKMATQDLNQQYQQIEQEGRSFVLGRRTLLWTVGCSRQVIDGLYLCRKTQWQKSRGCH